MITVHSRDDRSAESEAARELAELAANYDRDIEESRSVVLEIFASAQCFGQRTRDIDLLVFYADYRPESRLFRTKSGRAVHSFCATIELKGHSPEDVSFEGPKCFVRYRGEEHDVTTQSDRQKISLRKYIEGQPGKPKAPWILNVIWFSRINSGSLPLSTSNIVGMDLTWPQLLEKFALLDGGDQSPKNVETFSSRAWMQRILAIFSKKLEPSKIDRKKMEAITTSILDRQQYKDKLGQQLLIFRGRGGTGKTVRLIQMAYQAYNEEGLRVLILTYNKALVADISRILSLLGTRQSIGERSLSINSIYSFIYQWLVALEVIEKEQPDFIANYERHKTEAIELFKSGGLSDEDVAAAMKQNSLALQWDLIMIDESQDWPATERDLLYRIYGPSRFVLADGVDQLVRGTETTDWREGIDRSLSQIVPLHRSLRLKASLCQAVTHFAEQIDFANWKLEPLPEAHGGKVAVLTGNPLARDFYDKLTNTARSAGNQPIDILLCVPPSWVHLSDDNRKESRVASKLREWDLQVWDAADPENRETYPTSLEQFRVVQYESCRGLEGWVAVCFALDEFYQHKLDNAKISSGDSSDLFFSEEESARAYAKKWLMIPLTRAIDTLVVHVSDEDSFVGRAFLELHQKYPHDVTWTKLAD